MCGDGELGVCGVHVGGCRRDGVRTVLTLVVDGGQDGPDLRAIPHSLSGPQVDLLVLSQCCLCWLGGRPLSEVPFCSECQEPLEELL